MNGYTTSKGTYVAPHHRTRPDYTVMNNFSTVGNTNPYTGRAGYIYPTYSKSNTNISLPVVSISSNTSYSKNLQAVSSSIENLKSKLLNSGLEAQLIERIKNRFNADYLSILTEQKFDYSDSNVATMLINWLYDGLAIVAKDEFNKYTPNIQSGNYFYLKRKAILWDSPQMATANSLGEIASLKIQVIEKSNDAFYKVKSGNRIGYITATNFK